jgi:hypothetical protein
MRTKPTILIGGLVLLTLAQIYIVYAILWFSWLSATPNQNIELMRRCAERWELVSIPVGLLCIACLVALIRMRAREISAH